MKELDEEHEGFTEHLKMVAAKAALSGINSAFARGIPIAYREGNDMVMEWPDGRKKVLQYNICKDDVTVTKRSYQL